MDGQSQRIVLELEPGAEPISGLASAPPSSAVRFDGLIQLIAAIDSLRSSMPAGQRFEPVADGDVGGGTS